MTQETRFTIVSVGAASLVGLAVRTVLKRAWRAQTGRPPPVDPSAPDVSWREALAWSMASAGLVALGRIAGHRAAAAGWRTFVGGQPPRS